MVIHPDFAVTRGCLHHHEEGMECSSPICRLRCAVAAQSARQCRAEGAGWPQRHGFIGWPLLLACLLVGVQMAPDLKKLNMDFSSCLEEVVSFFHTVPLLASTSMRSQPSASALLRVMVLRAGYGR